MLIDYRPIDVHGVYAVPISVLTKDDSYYLWCDESSEKENNLSGTASGDLEEMDDGIVSLKDKQHQNEVDNNNELGSYEIIGVLS